MPDVRTQRATLTSGLFPGGIPSLWCPLITHYTAEGRIDGTRVAAHLDHLSPHVKGFLMPGSTGDGWEMSDEEVRELLDIALAEVERLGLHLLIGVLKTDAPSACRMIRELRDRFAGRKGIAGFTVCPPCGKELSQTQIKEGLESILNLGEATALYQLPQITQNEMSPELVAGLAARFPHFFLFKDTSGADRVVNSGLDLQGVFQVRGAEGDYVRWPRTGGGPYDGFLLSTANGLAAELHAVMEHLQAGRIDAARELSERLSNLVREVFALAAPLKFGNAFANANKALDHHFAFGPQAADITPPRSHAGSRLPVEMIRATGVALTANGFAPARGYLA